MSEHSEPLPSTPSRNAPLPLVIVAGPCSAESPEQILATAEALAHLPITYFRAGLWKPRTRPGNFEGVGEEGISWLTDVKSRTGLSVMTEVSLPEHVQKVLSAGIDAVWLGARTVSNPFAVQAIADALKGAQIPVFIKNPISPDVSLWRGAIERIQQVGITHVSAVFRGFSPIYASKLGYRNTPSWSVAFELRRQMPHIPLICDPSHITGRQYEVEGMCIEAVELGFDGIMVETHISPRTAKSDAQQQVTPGQLSNILCNLQTYRRQAQPQNSDLENYRKLLSEIDDTLLTVIAKRMEVAREIGNYKRVHHIPVLQLEHFSHVLETNMIRARKLNLPDEFVYNLFTCIHELSTRIQLNESKEQPHKL